MPSDSQMATTVKRELSLFFVGQPARLASNFGRMASRPFKALSKRRRELAGILTALGGEHRQRILMMFERRRELSVKEIADRFPLSRTALMHHIHILREAGVLLSHKRGSEIVLVLNTG